ncbi:hypothetical protein [Natrinema salsiterrestre]|uniref:DUF8173 domain-containing protein n=1 Tax=Natrinema salsiterrestre TaxID=2950540 RepID=A0A9Q4L5E9_9EURY|nr:hypothetical protein [Natrinema salsiterrestre]MDF9745601.1 hypothetical protein [Natrinema salsiterrestre]
MVVVEYILAPSSLPPTGIPAIAFGPLADSPLSQAAGVALSWMVVTATIAAVLVVAVPQSVRGLRNDAVTGPDTSFAVGFVAVFGVLVCSALPLYVGTSLEHPTLITAGLIAATPGLIACAALLLVGGCVGTLVAGDRVAGRLGPESPSLWRSLAVGTLVVGGSQLVPILGTIVTIVVGVVGSGAIVNRGYERWRGEPLLASSSARTAARPIETPPRTRAGRIESSAGPSERSVEPDSESERVPAPSGRGETPDDCGDGGRSDARGTRGVDTARDER